MNYGYDYARFSVKKEDPPECFSTPIDGLTLEERNRATLDALLSTLREHDKEIYKEDHRKFTDLIRLAEERGAIRLCAIVCQKYFVEAKIVMALWEEARKKCFQE